MNPRPLVRRGRSAARRVGAAAAVTAALFLATAGVTAEVVLEEGFADAALPPAWTVHAGDWRVVDGELEALAPPGEEPAARLLFGAHELRGVAVEASVRFVGATTEGGRVSLLARSRARRPGSGVRLSLDAAGEGLTPELAIGDARRWRTLHRGGSLAATRAPTTRAPTTRAPHRLRLEVRAEALWGYVDGRLAVRVAHAAGAPYTGAVGVELEGGTVRIDDIRVERLDDSDLAEVPPRPLVVAHRGFSWVAPENTLLAYRRAIEAGAELAECDVHLSADGVPVVLHDSTLERTTNGAGAVAARTAAELRALDAGSWKSSAFAGEPLPSLFELLELVRGKLRLVIEIKARGMEAEVVAALDAAEVAPADVMIFSFARETVARIVELEPGLPATWLVGDPPVSAAQQRETIAQAIVARASALGFPKERVYPELVRLAHECGFLVFAWTANTISDMRFLLDVGVDGIITDRPDVLIELRGR